VYILKAKETVPRRMVKRIDRMDKEEEE